MPELHLVPAPVVIDRSRLFLAFNAAMGLARQGLLDAGRVRRGLGLAQSREPIPYGATPHTCRCMDYVKKGGLCKHRIGASLRELARAA